MARNFILDRAASDWPPFTFARGALNIHDADIHSVLVNKLFNNPTGTTTTTTATVNPGDTTISITSGVGFTNGDSIKIENGFIEPTFPEIASGGGTTILTLDRPIDNLFSVGSSVEVIETNMAADGSVTPVAFRVYADTDQVWHITRFLIGMVHSSAADDSKFGSLAALTNGCVLRGYNASSGLYRTFTNWKNNADMKMDMFDVIYTDKAGGGLHGTNGRGSVKIGTGATPNINAIAGDYIELLIQDDLTGLDTFNMKAQGHIEGL